MESTETYEHMEYTEDGAVAQILLNRPQRRNARVSSRSGTASSPTMTSTPASMG